MTGREERDLKNEAWIDNKLENAPDILKSYMISKDSMTSMSRKAYLGYLLDYFGFIQERSKNNTINIEYFNEVKPMDIDAYMVHTKTNSKNGGKCGASVRNSKLAAVKSFYEFLEKNGIIKDNPCKNVEKIKNNKQRNVVSLSTEEIRTINDRIMQSYHSKGRDNKWKYRDLAIFSLGYTTGLRQSAIREINMDDISLTNRTVKVTEKNSVEKTMYLSSNTCMILKRWIEDREKLLGDCKCDALFISNRRERIGTRTLQDVVEKYTSDFGKHITPHKLRSTFAMNLYEATGDVYLVAEALGHKNIQNTRIYAKASERKMREAADLMDHIYG